jgi:hypothetical protein
MTAFPAVSQGFGEKPQTAQADPAPAGSGRLRRLRRARQWADEHHRVGRDVGFAESGFRPTKGREHPWPSQLERELN